MAGHVDDVFDG